jgi:hypothetical protein
MPPCGLGGGQTGGSSRRRARRSCDLRAVHPPDALRSPTCRGRSARPSTPAVTGC